MTDFKALEKIKDIATTDKTRIARVKDAAPYDIIDIDNDMLEIIDYVNTCQSNMSVNYPSFSNNRIQNFSYNNVLYHVVFTETDIAIAKVKWVDEIDDYSYEDFLDGYFDVYYYLDLNSKTVKFIWDKKEYIIKEK